MFDFTVMPGEELPVGRQPSCGGSGKEAAGCHRNRVSLKGRKDRGAGHWDLTI